MKTFLTLRLLALALGATTLFAQSAADQPFPGFGRSHGPRGDPLFALLDANHDGVIDNREIAAAPLVLRALAEEFAGPLVLDDFLPVRLGRPGNDDVSKYPIPAMFAAIDSNNDGALDAEEIANAAVSLKSLEKPGDEQITLADVRPAFGPGGRPGHGGFSGGHRSLSADIDAGS